MLVGGRVLRSGVRLIGAALIYGAIGVAFADPPSQAVPTAPYEQPRQNGNRAEPPHPAPAPEQQPQHRAYSADYQHACNKPESPEEADLCQQWRVAEATEKMIGQAERQFRTSIVEIVFLVLTVGLSAWAAKAASQAAVAAAAELELARRGFLFLQSVLIHTPRQNGSDNEKIFLFEVVFKNVGVSPIRITWVANSRHIIESGAGPKTIDWSIASFDMRMQTVIGPGGDFSVPENLNMQNAKMIFYDGYRFFFCVRIDYMNIFDNRKLYHTHQGFEVFIAGEPESIYEGDLSAEEYIVPRGYDPVSSAS